jgi:hypothetical protein
MKKLTVLAVALLSIVPIQAHAATPTIAIIDTAIDSSSIPQVSYEVCFTNNNSCPNGTKSQEGKGSANVDSVGWSITGMDHGTDVTQSALVANKNINIVFIRISDFTKATAKYAQYMYTGGDTIDRAIQWIDANASKYNISAVSISQERHNFAKGTCPTDIQFASTVQSLKTKNVPVLVGVGNDASVDFVGFPACVQDVIGVGAATTAGQNYYFSNLGAGVDLMSLGRLNIPMPNNTSKAVIGTSIATPYAAALWVTKITGQYDSQIAQLSALPKAKDGIKNLYPFLI